MYRVDWSTAQEVIRAALHVIDHSHSSLYSVLIVFSLPEFRAVRESHLFAKTKNHLSVVHWLQSWTQPYINEHNSRSGRLGQQDYRMDLLIVLSRV